MITRKDAVQRALLHGVTMEQIEAETTLQRRHVGTVPFNNMIKALNVVFGYLNTGDDWKRLAAALIAKGESRK